MPPGAKLLPSPCGARCFSSGTSRFAPNPGPVKWGGGKKGIDFVSTFWKQWQAQVPLNEMPGRHPETGRPHPSGTNWNWHNAGFDSAEVHGFRDASGLGYVKWQIGNRYDIRYHTRGGDRAEDKWIPPKEHEDYAAWFHPNKPPRINLGIPAHLAKPSWTQQQRELMARWNHQGVPPKPGNDISFHDLGVRAEGTFREPDHFPNLEDVKEVVEAYKY